MRIKKITVTVSAIILLSLFCVQASAIGFDNIKAVGITEAELEQGEQDKILRDEFSGLVAKLLSDEPFEAKNTVFTDVTETNAYSGAIDFLSSLGIINGVSDSEFAPKGVVSKTAAAKILVHILGYDTLAEYLGGYPEGYIKAADKLRLFSKVTAGSDSLSGNDALQMLENMLLAQNGNVNAFSVSDDGISLHINGKGDNFLTSGLGYSVYTGTVTAFSQKQRSMSLAVESNRYESNHTPLYKGQTVSLAAGADIDLAHWENVPVTVWVNQEDTVVYVKAQSGYSVLYGYINSVNGDTEVGSTYMPESVKRLTLEGNETEYNLARGAVLQNDGAAAGNAWRPVGQFARLIVKDDEICRVESYNMQEGGLILATDLKAGEITYMRESGKSVLSNLESSERVSVYIDGRSAEQKEIKADSVLAFYTDKDTMILTVSERMAVDVLNGIADDCVTVGAFEFKRSAACYFSSDGVTYQKNSGANALLGTEVEVFFAPDGKAAYIRPEGKVAEKNEFYGIVSGVKTHTLSKNAEIKLWRTEPDVCEKIYTVTDKTKWNGGVSLQVLQATAQNLNGEGIYYFKEGSDGKIREVSRCKPFSGYGDTAQLDLTSFYNDDMPYVYINNKALYFKNTKIVAVSELDGSFTVMEVPWSRLKNRTLSSSARLQFFSEEETAEPQLAVLTGSVQSLRSVALHFGIVTEKSQAQNEEGESVYRLKTLTQYGEKIYTLNEARGTAVKPNTLIRYYDDLVFSVNDIQIDSMAELSAPSDEWQLGTPDYGLQKGTVRKIDDRRIYLEDETYFMHPYNTFVVKVIEGNPVQKFRAAKKTDIHVGDTVFYNLYSGEVNMVMIVK